MDDRQEFGINITASNNQVLLSDMEEAVRTRRITVNSDRLVKELLAFEINENGKVEAAKGHHDDLISSLKLAVHGLNKLLETSPNLVSKLRSGANEPLSMDTKKAEASKYFKDLPIEEVKWILGKNN